MRKFLLVEQTRLNRFKISENQLLKTLFEDSQEAIFFLDPENLSIIECNKKAVELFQADNKMQLINLNFFDLYSTEPIEFSKNHIITNILNGNEYIQELSLKSLQNNKFWGRLSQKTVDTDSGKIILLRINKVIEYVRTSELLDSLIKQTSKVTGQAFFKVLSNLLSDTFEVKYVMTAKVIDDEKKIAKTVEFWSDNTKCENFTFELNNCPNSNVLNGYVTFYPNKLSELFPLFSFQKIPVESYLGAPIFTKDGKIVGILAIMDDKPMQEKTNVRHILSIFASRAGAELERMEAELLNKTNTDELIKINQTKDRFLQILAHDLKNPFHTIIGYSELLKNKVNSYDKEKINDIAKIINHSSKSCFSLLESLTEWSLSQNNLFQPHPKESNLFDMVEKAIELYCLSAEKKNIALVNLTDINEVIFADPLMILTVLRNIVSNAIKFSFSDSRIEISSIKNENETVICIEDFGAGMIKEDIEKVFQLNHVSRSGTENEQGNGLGMIICKDFVHLHKGKIWIESKPNKGTKVFFTIPFLT